MRTESEKEWILNAVDALSACFIVLSPEYEILSANRPAGRSIPENIIGCKCHEVIHNRASPCKSCAVTEVMARQEPTLRPIGDMDLEAGRVPCHYAYPIYRNGRLAAYASLEIDLPIRPGLEDVLQRSNAFLRKLLVSAEDAVIAADKKGRILIFNEMAASILGYDAEKAIREIGIGDLYPNDTAREVMQELRSEDYGGKGHLRSYRVELVTQKGETIPVNLNAAIVYEGEQEVATIGFFHDMREELRIKAELKKVQLQLMQAEKMASLGMLAAGVAHEINNPVAIMIEEAGWVEDLLHEEEFKSSENLKELDRALKQINNQGNRCKEITRKMLSFARTSQSGIQTVLINELIEDVVRLSLQRAQAAGVELKTSLQANLPATRISLSEMQQVLFNLVNNALDAMEKGGGTVSVSSRAERGRIRVEVADNGPGIAKDNLSKIFDPFYTTKPVGKGTGLGLFICYGIIKTMGGSIGVKSVVGSGTTFSVRIPLSDGAL